MWLPPFILHTGGISPLLLKTSFPLRRKDNCLLWGLAHLSHNSLSASFSKKTSFYSSVHSSKSVEVPWSTGWKSFPLTCPHAVICMSGAIKSSLPQMGFYTYIALAQVRKKRQIRSSLLLDMPRSDNHETPSWRNFCEQRIHHSFVEMEMQPTAPTQSSLCIWHSVCSWVFLSLRETSAIEQRQSIGQSWNPSSIYQSIIGKQASRKISTMMIHVLTSCPPRSAFL